MFIVWKQFTAQAAGSVIRDVTCERCGGTYAYELSRIAAGTGAAFYYLFQGAAKRRAQRGAAKNLAKALASDEELVPCPACGRVQTNAILAARRRSYRGMKQFGGVMAAIGLLAAAGLGVLAAFIERRKDQTMVIEFAVVFGLIGLFGLFLLYIRARLVRRFDPNAKPAGTWMPPAGTPPAIIPRQGPVIAPGGPEPTMAGAGAGIDEQMLTHADGAAAAPLAYASHPRCIVQAGRFEYPTCCGLCLSEDAPRRFKLPFSVRGDEIALPLCDACHAQVRRRAWRLTGFAVLAGAVIGLAIATIPWGHDPGARIGIGIFVGFFVMVGGSAALQSSRLRLCKARVIDASRGVFELWFANPEYGRRLMDDYRARETAGFAKTSAQ